MSARGRHAPAALLGSLCVACVAVEPAPRTDAGSLEVGATDFRGEHVPLDRLPRRPVLRLTHPDGFAQAPDAIVLLSGGPDPGLIEDLARAPLSSAQSARRIDSELALRGAQAMITPRVALAPGGRYTLAVAAWARSQRGTDLTAGRRPLVLELRIDDDPEAGARPLASWPADGASGIGTNLEAALIVFDGAVHGEADGIWLEGPDGLAVPGASESGPCERIAAAHAGRFCVRMRPEHRLAPGAGHRLRVGDLVRDGHGAPVGPWSAAFVTAPGSDLRPPSSLVLSCAVDEQAVELGCALVDDASIALRLQADEAVTATLSSATQQLAIAAPDGQLRLRLAGLAEDTAQQLELVLRDSAGNQTAASLRLRTLPALPALSVSEVLADPHGPEPQQEFVELVNYGAHAIDLLGFSLDDRLDMLGEPIARSVELAAGARALLVPDAYDATETRDVRPPPGALLVRVGAALASAGLRNAGEALFLRDALGRRISAAPGALRPRPGVCAVRVGEDMRSGEDAAFEHDPQASCTPGR